MTVGFLTQTSTIKSSFDLRWGSSTSIDTEGIMDISTSSIMQGHSTAAPMSAAVIHLIRSILITITIEERLRNRVHRVRVIETFNGIDINSH